MKSMRLPKSAGGFLLEGRSRAADATALALPELNWMLDCGAIIGESRPERVFITHTHSDHANRVTHVVSRARPPTIYVPDTTVEYVEQYINGHQAMTDNRPLEELLAAMSAGGDQWTINRRVKGVRAGETIEIKAKGRNFNVKVIACDHSVDCVGYAFYEAKERLKAEYQGLPGRELGRMRKEGIQLTEALETPLFAFMGDTTAMIFGHSDGGATDLLQFPVIITECTFLEDSEADNAKRTCHTLWSDLEATVTANSEVLFILIHFSLRYKASYVREFVAERKRVLKEQGHSSALDNVVLWLPDDSATERFVG